MIAISELVRGETVVSDEVVASVQQFDLIKVQVEHEQSILEGMPLRAVRRCMTSDLYRHEFMVMFFVVAEIVDYTEGGPEGILVESVSKVAAAEADFSGSIEFG